MRKRGFLKENAELLGVLLRLLDLTAIVMGGWLAYYLRLNTFVLELPGKIAVFYAVLGTLLLFPMFDLYRPWRGLSVWVEARTILIAWLSVVTIGLIVAYLTKTGAVFSRLWIGYWIVLAASFLVSGRVFTRAILRWSRTRGYNTRNVLVIGAGELGRKINQHLEESPWAGMRVVGYLDDDTRLHNTHIDGLPVYGGIDRLQELTMAQVNQAANKKSLNLTDVDQVWVALPLSAEAKIREVCRLLENGAISLIYVPDIFVHSLLNHSVDDLAGLPVVNLRVSPISGRAQMLKKLEDILISLAAIILTLPLMLLIAILIKLESTGSVLFKQRRYGIDGREIVIWKFRTMGVAEDGESIPQARKNDPRITRIGGFLRKSSLDELPQFFNVLQGRMSVVGPRPHAVAHNEQYRQIIERYMWRHTVKPGITGWAQVNGWRGETETQEKMEKRVEYDLEYLANWSIWLDLKIIIQTIYKGFVNANAH